MERELSTGAGFPDLPTAPVTRWLEEVIPVYPWSLGKGFRRNTGDSSRPRELFVSVYIMEFVFFHSSVVVVAQISLLW
jgi:hypothetical protein